MPGKDQTLVGIELSRSEIRAVAVKYRGAKPQVTAAAWCPLPEAGQPLGFVEQPGTIAIAVRKLLDGMNLSSGIQSVIGIPAEGTIMRTISVPAVPDQELATIVAGEVEHYRILQTKGSHAFIPLTPPITGAPDAPISVVIAAAEERVTKAIGEVANRANLKLRAAEPIEFGQLRSAVLGCGTTGSVFAILVTDSFTDLAVISSGQLWFYRRVDFGSRHLVGDERPSQVTASAFGANEDLLPAPENPIAKYSDSVVDSLANEILRSVDYLQRDYKEYAQFDRLHLSIDSPSLADFGPLLVERIGLPIELLPTFGGAPVAPEVEANVAGDEGFRFTGAFGLAVRDSVTFSAAVPRIDLYAADRTAVQTRLERRNLTGSLITSIVALVVGITGYLLFGSQASGVEAQVKVEKQRVLDAQNQATAKVAEQRERSDQYRALTENGVPITTLLDFVSTSLDPGVGLQSLTVGSDNLLTLTADAKDEASMLRTVENMQRVPVVESATVQSFTTRAATQGSGLSFTMTARALPASDVSVLPSSPVGGVQ